MGNQCCASCREKIDGEYKTLAKKQKELKDQADASRTKDKDGITPEKDTPSPYGQLDDDDEVNLVAPEPMP